MRFFFSVLILCLPLCCVASCGKSSRKSPAPTVKKIDARMAPFVAGKQARVYHRRGCAYAADLESPAGYATAHDADRMGLIPCEFCTPRATDRPVKE